MPEQKKSYILWTNDNENTSRYMVLFYATNAMTHGLWDDITVILWGAPVKLAAENPAIQEEIKIAQHVGAKFSACLSCARKFGVVEELEALGIEVIPWVEPFTELVKANETIIYV